jgi:tripartite-type tricarboxylate transporter receptor subunit TctC
MDVPMHGRLLVQFCCAVPLLLALPVAAQPYPARPVRFVVPFPPGAATDALARIIGQKLADALGQPVVVDNRAGAGGTIGTDVVAKAPADGHTLLMASTAFAINASLHARLPFDPLRDFAPVTLVAFLPNALLAHPGVPATGIRDLIALARSRPGQLGYASGGSGSAAHLAMELLKTSAGIDVLHVPYKGGGQAMNDVLGGQIALLFTSVYSAQPQVKAGRLRALGVASAKRTPLAPDLPTIAESGVPGYEVVAWYGVMAPRGTPASVVARLHAEIAKGLGTADSTERFASQGAELALVPSSAFADHVRSEVAKWAKVVKATGARVD